MHCTQQAGRRVLVLFVLLVTFVERSWYVKSISTSFCCGVYVRILRESRTATRFSSRPWDGKLPWRVWVSCPRYSNYRNRQKYSLSLTARGGSHVWAP